MTGNIRFDFFRLSAKYRIILFIYIVGFMVGVTTHSIDLIKGGFLPYDHVSLWKNIYWTSLTLLDFAICIILMLKIKWGLILANLIMISDVLINTSLLSLFNGYKIAMQITFCLFVMITTPLIFYDLRR